MRAIRFIQSNIRDKLSPIEVQMSYDLHRPLRDEDQTYTAYQLNSPVLKPVIDPKQNLRASSDAASLYKECGKDNICIPDLMVTYNV